MDAVRGNCKLAASIDSEHTHETEDASDDMALQEGSIVAEGEMVGATDCNKYSLIRIRGRQGGKRREHPDREK